MPDWNTPWKEPTVYVAIKRCGSKAIWLVYDYCLRALVDRGNGVRTLRSVPVARIDMMYSLPHHAAVIRVVSLVATMSESRS